MLARPSSTGVPATRQVAERLAAYLLGRVDLSRTVLADMAPADIADVEWVVVTDPAELAVLDAEGRSAVTTLNEHGQIQVRLGPAAFDNLALLAKIVLHELARVHQFRVWRADELDPHSPGLLVQAEIARRTAGTVNWDSHTITADGTITNWRAPGGDQVVAEVEERVGAPFQTLADHRAADLPRLVAAKEAADQEFARAFEARAGQATLEHLRDLAIIAEGDLNAALTQANAACDAQVRAVADVVANTAAIDAAQQALNAAREQFEEAARQAREVRTAGDRPPAEVAATKAAVRNAKAQLAAADKHLADAVRAADGRQATLILTGADGISRMVSISNLSGTLMSLDAAPESVRESPIVAVQAVVVSRDGTWVPFTGRPLGLHSSCHDVGALSPEHLAQLPEQQQAEIRDRLVLERPAPRTPGDAGMRQIQENLEEIRRDLPPGTAIEAVGNSWYLITTPGGSQVLLGAQRGELNGDSAGTAPMLDSAGTALTAAGGRPCLTTTMTRASGSAVIDEFFDGPANARLAADRDEALFAGQVAGLVVRIDEGVAAAGEPLGRAFGVEDVLAIEGHVAATEVRVKIRQLLKWRAARDDAEVSPWTWWRAELAMQRWLKERARELGLSSKKRAGEFGLTSDAPGLVARRELLTRYGYGDVATIADTFGATWAARPRLPMTADRFWVAETLPRLAAGVGARSIDHVSDDLFVFRCWDGRTFTMAVAIDGNVSPAGRTADVVMRFPSAIDVSEGERMLAGQASRVVALDALARRKGLTLQDAAEQAMAGRFGPDLLVMHALSEQVTDDSSPSPNDYDSVGWWSAHRQQYARASWHEKVLLRRRARERAHDEGLLRAAWGMAGSPDYDTKMMAFFYVTDELGCSDLVEYLERMNGARRSVRPLAEVGADRQRLYQPRFDVDAAQDLVGWLKPLLAGIGLGISYDSGQIRVVQLADDSSLLSMTVEQAELEGLHWELLHGRGTSEYVTAIQDGLDYWRGKQALLTAICVAIEQHTPTRADPVPMRGMLALALWQHHVGEARGPDSIVLRSDLRAFLRELVDDPNIDLTALPAEVTQFLNEATRTRGGPRHSVSIGAQEQEFLANIRDARPVPSRIPSLRRYGISEGLQWIPISFVMGTLGVAAFDVAVWQALLGIALSLPLAYAQMIQKYRTDLGFEIEHLETIEAKSADEVRASRQHADAVGRQIEAELLPILQALDVTLPEAAQSRRTDTDLWVRRAADPPTGKTSFKYQLIKTNIPLLFWGSFQALINAGLAAGQWTLAAAMVLMFVLQFLTLAKAESARGGFTIARWNRQLAFKAYLRKERLAAVTTAFRLRASVAAVCESFGVDVPAARFAPGRRPVDYFVSRPRHPHNLSRTTTFVNKVINRGLGWGVPNLLSAGAFAPFDAPVAFATLCAGVGNALVWPILEVDIERNTEHQMVLLSNQQTGHAEAGSRQATDEQLQRLAAVFQTLLTTLRPQSDAAGDQTSRIPGTRVVPGGVSPEHLVPYLPPLLRVMASGAGPGFAEAGMMSAGLLTSLAATREGAQAIISAAVYTVLTSGVGVAASLGYLMQGPEGSQALTAAQALYLHLRELARGNAAFESYVEEFSGRLESGFAAAADASSGPALPYVLGPGELSNAEAAVAFWATGERVPALGLGTVGAVAGGAVGVRALCGQMFAGGLTGVDLSDPAFANVRIVVNGKPDQLTYLDAKGRLAETTVINGCPTIVLGLGAFATPRRLMRVLAHELERVNQVMWLQQNPGLQVDEHDEGLLAWAVAAESPVGQLDAVEQRLTGRDLAEIAASDDWQAVTLGDDGVVRVVDPDTGDVTAPLVRSMMGRDWSADPGALEQAVGAGRWQELLDLSKGRVASEEQAAGVWEAVEAGVRAAGVGATACVAVRTANGGAQTVAVEFDNGVMRYAQPQRSAIEHLLADGQVTAVDVMVMNRAGEPVPLPGVRRRGVFSTEQMSDPYLAALKVALRAAQVAAGQRTGQDRAGDDVLNLTVCSWENEKVGVHVGGLSGVVIRHLEGFAKDGHNVVGVTRHEFSEPGVPQPPTRVVQVEVEHEEGEQVGTVRVVQVAMPPGFTTWDDLHRGSETWALTVGESFVNPFFDFMVEHGYLPDAVMTHDQVNTNGLARVAKAMGVPLVAETHFPEFVETKGKVGVWQFVSESFATRVADARIAVSEIVGKSLTFVHNLAAGAIHVIGNGANLAAWDRDNVDTRPETIEQVRAGIPASAAGAPVAYLHQRLGPAEQAVAALGITTGDPAGADSTIVAVAERAEQVLAALGAFTARDDVDSDAVRAATSLWRHVAVAADQAAQAQAVAVDGLPEDAELIFFIGRLEERKGLHDLFTALCALHTERPNVHVVLIGEGTYKPTLVDLKHQLETTGDEQGRRLRPGQVHWLGKKSPEEAAQIAVACDVAATPSSAEGDPLVVKEYAAAGLAQVATADVVPFVVDRVTGLSVPVGDPAALAVALGTLLRDKALAARVAVNARAELHARHTWPALVGHIIQILRDAIRRGPTHTPVTPYVPATRNVTDVARIHIATTDLTGWTLNSPEGEGMAPRISDRGIYWNLPLAPGTTDVAYTLHHYGQPVTIDGTTRQSLAVTTGTGTPGHEVHYTLTADPHTLTKTRPALPYVREDGELSNQEVFDRRNDPTVDSSEQVVLDEDGLRTLARQAYEHGLTTFDIDDPANADVDFVMADTPEAFAYLDAQGRLAESTTSVTPGRRTVVFGIGACENPRLALKVMLHELKRLDQLAVLHQQHENLADLDEHDLALYAEAVEAHNRVDELDWDSTAFTIRINSEGIIITSWTPAVSLADLEYDAVKLSDDVVAVAADAAAWLRPGDPPPSVPNQLVDTGYLERTIGARDARFQTVKRDDIATVYSAIEEKVRHGAYAVIAVRSTDGTLRITGVRRNGSAVEHFDPRTGTTVREPIVPVRDIEQVGFLVVDGEGEPVPFADLPRERTFSTEPMTAPYFAALPGRASLDSVLQVAWEYVAIEGGLGIVLKNLLPKLASRGCKVTILTRQPVVEETGRPAPGTEERTVDGVHAIATGLRKRSQYREDYLRDDVIWCASTEDEMVNALYDYMQRTGKRFALVQGHDWVTTRAAQVLKEAFGDAIRFVLHIHDVVVARWLGSVRNPLVALKYPLEWIRARFADAVIVNSPHNKAMAGWVDEIPLDRIKVIPNGVDVSKQVVDRGSMNHAQALADLGYPPETILMFAWGRMMAIDPPLSGHLPVYDPKGYTYLIEAMPAIKIAVDHVRLLQSGADFGGERDLRDQVDQLVRDGRLAEDDVRLAGFLSNENRDNAKGVADLVVAASPYEGFGLTLLEAGAARAPVVGTAVFASMEDKVTGRVVPAMDPVALAIHVIAALLNPDVTARWAENAFAQAISDRFDWNTIAQRTVEEVYIPTLAADSRPIRVGTPPAIPSNGNVFDVAEVSLNVPDGDAAGWTLSNAAGSDEPSLEGRPPDRIEDGVAYWRVPLAGGATELHYRLHHGEETLVVHGRTDLVLGVDTGRGTPGHKVRHDTADPDTTTTTEQQEPLPTEQRATATRRALTDAEIAAKGIAMAQLLRLLPVPLPPGISAGATLLFALETGARATYGLPPDLTRLAELARQATVEGQHWPSLTGGEWHADARFYPTRSTELNVSGGRAGTGLTMEQLKERGQDCVATAQDVIRDFYAVEANHEATIVVRTTTFDPLKGSFAANDWLVRRGHRGMICYLDPHPAVLAGEPEWLYQPGWEPGQAGVVDVHLSVAEPDPDNPGEIRPGPPPFDGGSSGANRPDGPSPSLAYVRESAAERTNADVLALPSGTRVPATMEVAEALAAYLLEHVDLRGTVLEGMTPADLANVDWVVVTDPAELAAFDAEGRSAVTTRNRRGQVQVRLGPAAFDNLDLLAKVVLHEMVRVRQFQTRSADEFDPHSRELLDEAVTARQRAAAIDWDTHTITSDGTITLDEDSVAATGVDGPRVSPAEAILRTLRDGSAGFGRTARVDLRWITPQTLRIVGGLLEKCWEVRVDIGVPIDSAGRPTGAPVHLEYVRRGAIMPSYVITLDENLRPDVAESFFWGEILALSAATDVPGQPLRPGGDQLIHKAAAELDRQLALMAVVRESMPEIADRRSGFEVLRHLLEKIRLVVDQTRREASRQIGIRRLMVLVGQFDGMLRSLQRYDAEHPLPAAVDGQMANWELISDFHLLDPAAMTQIVAATEPAISGMVHPLDLAIATRKIEDVLGSDRAEIVLSDLSIQKLLDVLIANDPASGAMIATPTGRSLAGLTVALAYACRFVLAQRKVVNDFLNLGRERLQALGARLDHGEAHQMLALATAREMLWGLFGAPGDPSAVSLPVGDAPWDWLLSPEAGDIAVERFRRNAGRLGRSDLRFGAAVPTSWLDSGVVAVDGSRYLNDSWDTFNRAWNKPFPADTAADTRFARWEALSGVFQKVYELDMLRVDLTADPTIDPFNDSGPFASLVTAIGQLHDLVVAFNAVHDPTGEDLRGIDLLGFAELQRVEGRADRRHLIDVLHHAAIVKLMELAFQRAVADGVLGQSDLGSGDIEALMVPALSLRHEVLALTRPAVTDYLHDAETLRQLDLDQLLLGDGLYLDTRPPGELDPLLRGGAAFVKCGPFVTMAAALTHELVHVLQPSWWAELDRLEAEDPLASPDERRAALTRQREDQASRYQWAFLQGLVRHYFGLPGGDLTNPLDIVPAHLRPMVGRWAKAELYVATRMPLDLGIQAGGTVWVESAFASTIPPDDSPILQALRASGPSPSGPSTPATQSGLADPAAIADYAAAMRGLEGEWPSLPVAVRVQRVEEALNAQLARNDVPPIRLLPTRNLPRKVDGRFDCATWTVRIDESIIVADDPTSFATLVQCPYHEGRHVEQAFLMARLMAGRGAGPGTIRHTLRITRTDVLAAAVAEPLLAGSPEYEAARSWLNSVVGEGLEATNRLVGTELPAARAKYAQAKERYLAKRTDGSVDYAERMRLYQAVLDAKQEAEDLYERYRRLPEEADAWVLGNAVSRAFGRPVVPPPVDVPPPPVP